ncbi:hypothetical protein TVAG_163360 [Trichomonas vaginalis G3]|uniref:Translocon-associated protein subunit beta n=1 Tax=Trichomonas vaginalis (strain ATCC PRA-98 / G3) TaxID=412133 RepID=A2DG10_TRIV3|nr:translocon-associated protein beta (TRAPB) family [Trichomonas vaginalis G3]XP_001581626.1 translocon-associated protein beta (TRAPB) family [Trichomonas vaginalis G3]EAY20637.1 hypothetical protein TVAG_163330 [Trichomonas vaginalis G3]EAY20640.1 hypothetical protein TVAG_163360 [Trichomonas vaginalis G3]KAI5487352.1 translocon-associated protein beta (TRAPB) family [Trichomonas vaginalis G3]KAI5487361.1 translocon-associated protein beta (TRAPB) family [Trichomonas vaginalis G3]|eukprot:XP_001581623.1 hypothetical protein [Trichomonas vaginalis G3]
MSISQLKPLDTTKMFGLSLLLTQIKSAPFIVFDKKLSSVSGKVGEPINCYYVIINQGDSTVTDLSIVENGIPSEAWSFSGDSSILSWKSLKPGENITHIFPITPTKSGNLQIMPSTMIYYDGNEKQKHLSSMIPFIEIKGSRSIGARANLQGYCLFIVAAASSVLVPLLLWWVSRKGVSTTTKPKTN